MYYLVSDKNIRNGFDFMLVLFMSVCICMNMIYILLKDIIFIYLK